MIRSRHAWTDAALAAAAVAAGTAPLWRMGWLRDDWLMLWQALDPATAPAGAGGVFPRPVAALLWRLSAALAGDAAWAMHALMVLAWLALVAGALRWHRTLGGGTAGAAVAALALALHGALVEARLWAAAGNGPLAGALAVWGAWLLHAGPGRVRRAAGAGLLVLAALARADALVLLVLPVVAGVRPGRRLDLLLALLAAAGAAALAVMVAAGGGWTLRPGDSGRLLRLLLVPWGPPLPAAAALAVGAAGVVAAVAGGRLLAARAPRTAAFLLAAGAVAAAGALVDWTAAGRYVLMPAVPLALVLGAGWEREAPSPRTRRLRRAARGGIFAWLLLSVLAVTGGRTAGELHRISVAETGLYRAVRAALPWPADHVTLVDPPAVGWSGSVADLENVVSAAARRPLVVGVARGDDSLILPPAVSWRLGAWTVGLGDEPR